MNNSESAKKGFKTFILTLSISLIVFSAIYYALTTYSPTSGSTPLADAQALGAAAVAETPVTTPAVSADKPTDNVKGITTERKEETKTVFATIAEKKPNTHAQEVLGGMTVATETTQSGNGVPATGYVEMTIGLVASMMIFVGVMVYTSMNPRRIALHSFEKRVIKKS
jgi:hypothetical protein